MEAETAQTKVRMESDKSTEVRVESNKVLLREGGSSVSVCGCGEDLHA